MSSGADIGNPDTVKGWVYDCGTRGTLDIIYGCVVVLVAAIWTVVHLNVPAKGDSDARIFWRKLRWGLVSIIAPDFLTLVAAAQWDSATKSVEEMKELTRDKKEDWTLVHAFYANSGGFVLESPDMDPFPITATSVHYLVSRGYMALPTITRDEIWDKSKADVFAKGLALLQAIWIFLMAIARTAQGLPLTPLELFTLAFVISTVMSYFFWWRKPQHVGTPTRLVCDTTMARVRADAGYPDDAPYTDTPLDFVEKPTQGWKRRAMFEDYDLESGKRKMERTQIELPAWNPRSEAFTGELSGNSSSCALVQPAISQSEFEHGQEAKLVSPLSSRAPTLVSAPQDAKLISPLSSRSSTLVVPQIVIGESKALEGLRIEAEPATLTASPTSLKLDTIQEKLEDIALERDRDPIAVNTNQTPSTIQTIVSWTQSPRKRIPDDSIMATRLPTKMVILLMIPSVIHSSIHLAGWNHKFPTQVELILWRVSVVLLASMSCMCVGVVRILGLRGYGGKYNLLWVWVNTNADERSRGMWDVALAVSTFLLILARLYLITEVCISLRQQPAEVYVDVNWVNYIPHI